MPGVETGKEFDTSNPQNIVSNVSAVKRATVSKTTGG